MGLPPAIVMGVSFSGELAYEIHVANQYLYSAWMALQQAGAAFDMKLFGARAVESMRMEKGFLHWKADILVEFDPFETGLARFVAMDKPDFIGKDALVKHKADKKRVTLIVECKTAPVLHGASVMQGERVVGTITSGAYGYRVDKNLGYAFMDSGQMNAADLTLDLMGERVAVQIIPDCPYDANHSRMRG